MKAALLMRLVAPVAWGNQQTPKEQSKEMAGGGMSFPI